MISGVRGFLDWWVGRWTAPSDDIDGQPPAWDPLWVRVAEGVAFRLGVGLEVPTAGIIALRGTTGLAPDEFMPFLPALLILTLAAVASFFALDILGTFKNRWDKPRFRTRTLITLITLAALGCSLRAWYAP